MGYNWAIRYRFGTGDFQGVKRHGLFRIVGGG